MKLTVGRIFSETFSTMKDRFWGLFGLWAAFFGLMLAAIVVFGMIAGGSAATLAGAVDDPAVLADGVGVGLIAALVVFYLAYVLLVCAQYAAMNAMASPLRQADFGEAFSVGWRSAPTLLGVMIVFLIGYVLAAMAAGLVGALGTAGAVVGTVLLIGVMLYLASRLLIVFPVVPVDGVRNPFKAIGRAWRLTAGQALPIFLSLLAFVALLLLLMALMIIPIFGTVEAISEGGTAPAIGSMLFAFAAVIVLSIVVAIAYAAHLSAVHALVVRQSEESLSETTGQG